MPRETQIKRLTLEQEADLPRIRDHWLRVGLQTGPGDRDRAWRGICAAYTVAGLAQPKWMIWMRSPLEMCRAAVQIEMRDQVLDQVRDQVLDQVLDQVRVQVLDQVLDQVRAQVSAQVLAQMHAQVLARACGYWCPGQFDSYWLSWISALRDYCDYGRIFGLSEVAHSCAFAWMYPDSVIFCDHPTYIRRDEQHRLHMEGGQAISFADGWGIWVLHGVRVSQRVAETPAYMIPIVWWAEEKNVEVRHEIEKRIGSERLLRDLEAKMIHADLIVVGGRDLPYEVQEVTLPNGGRRRLLAMTNPSTGEIHREWVPLEITTCREAVCWRNGTQDFPEILT